MKQRMVTPINGVADKDSIHLFSPLLQKGFKVPAKLGCTLNSLLHNQFGLSKSYVSQRIRTIFLNGKPVDDPATAMVGPNAVLAMSAAMPGLVGAAFRCNGPLSTLRSNISYTGKDGVKRSRCCGGLVTLKLFNLLVLEMGPIFLEKGIWVDSPTARKMIEENQKNWQSLNMTLDGDTIELEPSNLSTLNRAGKWCRIRVRFQDPVTS